MQRIDRLNISFVKFYQFFGFQVYPQLLQRLTVLLEPIVPQNQLTPLAPAVIAVELHLGIFYWLDQYLNKKSHNQQEHLNKNNLIEHSK